MFIQNLDTNQQSILLAMAEEVIAADGDLHELQLGLLDLIRSQATFGLKPQKIEDSKLPETFDTSRSKYSLMLELIGVANANNEYHDEEKKLIKRYAEALDIDQSKLSSLEAWVEKQLALTIEVDKIFREE